LNGSVLAGISRGTQIQQLQAAHINGVSLTRANLQGAYLAGTAWRGVNLKWADLSDAVLTDTVRLNRRDQIVTTSFSGVSTNTQTVLP
jgi:uncharacterized protein YjbI with pentapeptide repeats